MKSYIGLFIGLLVSISASAESLLEGQVRLESGQPAAGVQVRLFDLTNLHQSVGTTTDETGHFTLSLPASAPGSALPQGFALGQNYPNPFNPSTIIPYQIPTATHVRLEVFNVLGQRVATLVDAERPAGFRAAKWTATDATGQAVGAGVYFYRLVSGGATVSRRMVLIDGQAGRPAAGAAGPIPASAAAHSPADAGVYGLTVSGTGVVAYVNPAFRVGVGEAEIVLEAASGSPRMKRAAGGILGDVNNDGQVGASDAYYVALYREDSSITLPNNGDISLGDLNKDGTVDFADVELLGRYLVDPSDPTLPTGIGKPVVAPVEALAPPDEQTFNSQMVGKSLHAETFFLDFVSAGRFSESVAHLPGSYRYSNTGSNTGLLTLTYDGGQNGGGCTMQLTFASATTGTLTYTCDSGVEGRTTWRISEIGIPLAPRVAPSSDTELDIRFPVFFEAGETRAYDLRWRTKTPQGSWVADCTEFTNTRGRALGTVFTGIVNLQPGTVYEVRYRYRNSSRCGAGTPGPWSEIGEGATTGTRRLGFPDGESTTRSIPENIPAGINVGVPVSAVGGNALTYTISGLDALSFDIVPDTGQIRTREGVTYDYESKNHYFVTVEVEDDRGSSAEIDVTINIVDLAPSCGLPDNLNLRTNHGDERLTLRWDSLPNIQHHARVLGYQTEIRQGSSGAWTDRRTFLSRTITGMIYAALNNEIGYQVRVRPVNQEGDCRWSAPVWGTPTADFAPKDSPDNFDRFGLQPVGSPDRNFRFLTPERCRHTSNGRTLDADCQYENTGPHTGRIFLEFDDSSQGSCEVTLAYSSLTAGSFIDECFDAGVNTNVPFDRSFRMPGSAPQIEDEIDVSRAVSSEPYAYRLGKPQAEDEIDVPRAPRTAKEFNALAWRRDDFIPGLIFGCPPLVSGCSDEPSDRAFATKVELDERGKVKYSLGTYRYVNTGSSQAKLTVFHSGRAYVFTLDFNPTGNIRVTTTDPAGEPAAWPGMLRPSEQDALAQPTLLPIPPSWSAAIAIETDFAPSDLDDARYEVLKRMLFPIEEEGFMERRYEKIGRNRALMNLEFSGSTWLYDLTFISDQAAKFNLTVKAEGSVSGPIDSIADFLDDDDEFPEELLLPDDPPQASGEDVSGAEVAAAFTASSIGTDDLQTFLVSNAGTAYQPGDWLEPKDGSNQRMMVVGTGPPAKPVAPSDPASSLPHQRILKVQSAVSPHALPVFASALARRAKRASQSVYLTSSSTITQLSVVCMQLDHDIPTRGARYFSQPKTARDAVQLCQQNCVLNETDNIQECVWNCEEKDL